MLLSMIFSDSCATARELSLSVPRMTTASMGKGVRTSNGLLPASLTVQAARFLSTCSGRWMSWFASVLRSQRGNDQPVRDSVGRAIPKEDAQRGEVHRQ